MVSIFLQILPSPFLLSSPSFHFISFLFFLPLTPISLVPVPVPKSYRRHVHITLPPRECAMVTHSMRHEHGCHISSVQFSSVYIKWKAEIEEEFSYDNGLFWQYGTKQGDIT